MKKITRIQKKRMGVRGERSCQGKWDHLLYGLGTRKKKAIIMSFKATVDQNCEYLLDHAWRLRWEKKDSD